MTLLPSHLCDAVVKKIKQCLDLIQQIPNKPHSGKGKQNLTLNSGSPRLSYGYNKEQENKVLQTTGLLPFSVLLQIV